MLGVGFHRVWLSQSHFLLLIWACACPVLLQIFFFVCDFVLPFDVKDGPEVSVNESLHFVC